MDDITFDNVKEVGDVTVAPSVGEYVEQCEFKRGFCLRHKAKGEKFIEVSRRWRDRGGGKGFDWITSRRVRYRCRGRDNPGSLKSAE